MDGINEADRLMSKKLLYRECDNLMDEIKRLNSELSMQGRRLKNLIALVRYNHLSVPILISIVVRGYRSLQASM